MAEPILRVLMLSGVVLAGGRSSRLGKDKGLALLRGRPLVIYVARTLSQIADEVLISTSRDMARRYGEAVQGEFSMVEDSLEGIGPLQGLVSSLEVAKGEYTIFSPCDTPFLKASVCRAIIDRAAGHDGAVPIVRGEFEPLHAAYRTEPSLRAFKDTIVAGKRRIVDAYDKLRLERVEEDVLRSADPDLLSFWNLNRPEDLEEAETKMKQ